MDQVNQSASQKAEAICRYMWQKTLSYLNETNAPVNSFTATYLWSACFYTIQGILSDNDLTEEVLNQFVPSIFHIF